MSQPVVVGVADGGGGQEPLGPLRALPPRRTSTVLTQGVGELTGSNVAVRVAVGEFTAVVALAWTVAVLVLLGVEVVVEVEVDVEVEVAVVVGVEVTVAELVGVAVASEQGSVTLIVPAMLGCSLHW